MRFACNGLRLCRYKTPTIPSLARHIPAAQTRSYSSPTTKQWNQKDEDFELPLEALEQVEQTGAAPENHDQPVAPPVTRTITANSVIPIGVEAAIIKNVGKLIILDLSSRKPAEPPLLEHELERVLFNPGVARLQCPRTGVFNFPRHLKSIPPISRFKADRLPRYCPPAQDPDLRRIFQADKETIRYVGATSTCTGVLQKLHQLISHWRPINVSHLSKQFRVESTQPTNIQTAPLSLILENAGSGQRILSSDYKFGDETKELMQVGHMLELMLTASDAEFEGWLKPETEVNTGSEVDSPTLINPPLEQAREETQPQPQPAEHAFNYLQIGSFLVRSQLDARHPRLSVTGGPGYFDIKTRAVLAVRMDPLERSQDARHYTLTSQSGVWSSYERETYDLMRTMMLKYSLQARLGQMEGIFMAHHNLTNMMGFQYLSIADMDEMMHGQRDEGVGRYFGLGGQEMKLSILMLEHIFDKIVSEFKTQDIYIHFDAPNSKNANLYIFAEEVNDDLLKDVGQCTRDLEDIAQQVAKNHDSVSVNELASLSDECDQLLAEAHSLTVMVGHQAKTLRRKASKLSAGGLSLIVTSSIKLNQRYKQLRSTADMIPDAHLRSQVQRTMRKIKEALEDVDRLNQNLPEELYKDSTKVGEARYLEANPAPPMYEWKHEPKKLVGYQVSVHNFVDDRPVIRPERLTPRQKWSIKYTIVTLREDETNRRYHDMLKRKINYKNAEDTATLYKNGFYKQIQRISQQAKGSERSLMERSRTNDLRYEAGLAAANSPHASAQNAEQDIAPGSGRNAYVEDDVKYHFDDPALSVTGTEQDREIIVDHDPEVAGLEVDEKSD